MFFGYLFQLFGTLQVARAAMTAINTLCSMLDVFHLWTFWIKSSISINKARQYASPTVSVTYAYKRGPIHTYPGIIFCLPFTNKRSFRATKTLWFKAQYTRIAMFIHKKYAPTRSVSESFSPVHTKTLNMYDTVSLRTADVFPVVASLPPRILLLLLLLFFLRERSDERKYVCNSQARSVCD